MLCNMEAGTHYIGLYGGTACANFEISMELVDGAEECHEISHNVALEEAKEKERLVALRPHHSQYVGPPPSPGAGSLCLLDWDGCSAPVYVVVASSSKRCAPRWKESAARSHRRRLPKLT